ncbi:MAG: hypothetical protein RDV48_21480 [Candidatus Eremiobacteraeota bacterium]|nr:hypothetical protein [Candidatus Eremiobacteraeota bacterium]
MMEEQKKGFSYTVSPSQIDEYKSWPVERRLEWLLYGNMLRRELPEKTRELHDAFREGRQ